MRVLRLPAGVTVGALTLILAGSLWPASARGAEAGFAQVIVFDAAEVIVADEFGNVDSLTASGGYSRGIPRCTRYAIEPEEESGPYHGPVGWIFGLKEPFAGTLHVWVRASPPTPVVQISWARGDCEDEVLIRITEQSAEWHRIVMSFREVRNGPSCGVGLRGPWGARRWGARDGPPFAR